MGDLNLKNFVTKIKNMSQRNREKLEVQTLVNLIIQLPEDIDTNLTNTVNNILTTLAEVQNVTLRNAQDIVQHKEEILKLNRINGELAADSTKLKEENESLKYELDGVQQYLRVNNLEITGLVTPSTTTSTSMCPS